MSQKFSRRMFLRGLGQTSLAIPFLPSLMPRSAWGQMPTGPKRFFSFVGDYDYGHHQHWFPTLNQLSNQYVSPRGDHTIRYQALSSFVSNPNDELSYIFGSSLNPYLAKMNLLRGLNLHTRIAHGQGHMLGNVAATDGHDSQVNQLPALPTIDQVLASNRNFTPYDLDPLLIGGSSFSFRREASGQISRVPGRHVKPDVLFNSLFGGISETPQEPSTHPRADVLSRVYEDYQRIRTGRQISSMDAQILDNALDRISDLQRRLGQTSGGGACRFNHIDTSRSQNDGLGADQYSPENQTYAFDLYAQIFAAAASCDLHRVFNFHTGNLNSLFDRHPGENFHDGHSHIPWETVTSNNNRINHQYMAYIYRLYIQEFVSKLAFYLDQTIESDGKSLLDNSLVFMTLESSLLHCDSSKPCLLLGGAGGALTTGHMIDYSRRELGRHGGGDQFSDDPNNPRFNHNYYGAHYNRVLTTILQAMGLRAEEYENPSINSFFQNRSDGLIGAHNNGISRIGGYGHIGSVNSGVGYYTNSQLYQEQYARYNYHFYKDSLPFPTASAS